MDPLDLISRLEKLDACSVSDALDSHGVVGVANGITRRSTRQKIAGRVRTLRLAAGTPKKSPTAHIGSRSIEAATDIDVIVIEQRTGIEAAAWGGVLSEAAHHKHIRGVVVDGPVRDIDDICETGLPVFSRGVTPLSARGRIHEAAMNEPVDICGLTVLPDDFVIGDGTGVVFIPAGIAEAVISAAERIAARERAMVGAVHENAPVMEIMGRDYEKMAGTQD